MERTTLEFSQSSSVHGIQYIFESGKNLALSRILWLVFVIVAAGLGIHWSKEVHGATFEISATNHTINSHSGL